MTSSWFQFFRNTTPKVQPLHLQVGYNLDDMPASVMALVRTMQPALNGTQPWQLDLTGSDYIGPYAGSIIVATLLESRTRGVACELVMPTKPPRLVDSCRRSGLAHFAGLGSPPPQNELGSETIPMSTIQQVTFSTPDPIIELIRRHTSVDDELEENLRTCVNEVVQNVVDHAASPIHALTAARYIRSKQQIRIAIVDRGDGIGTTVRRRHPEFSTNRDAIARVMQGGVSAKSRPNNMGVGVSNLCAIVQHQLKGRVFIVSEDTAVNRLPDSDHWTYLDQPFPGTAVFLNVPVD